MADSSTGGFIAPISTPPLNDQALYVALQATVTGITGMPGTLVWPRWQANPAGRPAITVDWAAIGTTTLVADAFPFEDHDPTGEGSSTLQVHEEVDVLISFYGPNCEANSKLLRDGLKVSQNREAMYVFGFKLIEASGHTKSADMVNNQWYPRADLTVRIRRQVDRTYPILNLESLDAVLVTDRLDGPITVPTAP